MSEHFLEILYINKNIFLVILKNSVLFSNIFMSLNHVEPYH